jgi:hypothetical protein
MGLYRVLVEQEDGRRLVAFGPHAASRLEIGLRVVEPELGTALLLHRVDIGVLSRKRLVDHLPTDLVYHHLSPAPGAGAVTWTMVWNRKSVGWCGP